MNPYLIRSGLIVRFFSILYDVILLIGILFIFGLIFALFSNELIFSENKFHLIYRIYLHIIIFLYFFLFLKKYNQTPAMKILNLYLLDKNQKPIETKTLVLRLIYAYFSIFIFGIGFLMGFFNKDKKTLYDHLTHSFIFKLKKKPNPKKLNKSK